MRGSGTGWAGGSSPAPVLDPDRGAQLAADAGAIFGGGVLLALQTRERRGRSRRRGMAARAGFAAAVEAGDAGFSVVVLRRIGSRCAMTGVPATLAGRIRPRLSRQHSAG